MIIIDAPARLPESDSASQATSGVALGACMHMCGLVRTGGRFGPSCLNPLGERGASWAAGDLSRPRNQGQGDGPVSHTHPRMHDSEPPNGVRCRPSIDGCPIWGPAPAGPFPPLSTRVFFAPPPRGLRHRGSPQKRTDSWCRITRLVLHLDVVNPGFGTPG